MRWYQRAIGTETPAHHRGGIHDDLLQGAASDVASAAAAAAATASSHALIGSGGVDGNGTAAAHIANGLATAA